MNPKVDAFINQSGKWKEAIGIMQRIALECGLNEELKWGQPCYTYQGKNIVLIHAFKDYCAYLFHKGVLLNDTHHILIQQTKNVQSARQIRFTGSREILDQEAVLKAYILEAVEIEKAGLKVAFKSTSEFEVPEEFQRRMNDVPALKKAFEALTPGRQRAYLLYFGQPKQPGTRISRIERSVPRIFEGKGLNDQ